MSFDNPFDAGRALSRGGCACGKHATQAEHDSAASSDERLARVVQSAVVRALFPEDQSRRVFLRAVGASTALAAISQFFPLGTAMEAFAQAGPPEKKDLKVGFIPITCATPIIMAHPMGFYTKHGLNVEVVKTAGWAVVRDKTINKEYDAAHMLSPMPHRHHAGRRLQRHPLHHAGGGEHQRAGHHAGRQAQGQARPQELEGLQVRGAVRLLDAQLPAALLRGRARHRSRPGHTDPRRAAAGDGRQPARRQHRRLPGARSRQPARRLRRRRLHPHSVEGHLGSSSLLRVRRVQGVRHAPRPTPTRRCSRRSSTRPRSRPSPRTASRSPKPSRRPTTSTSR